MKIFHSLNWNPPILIHTYFGSLGQGAVATYSGSQACSILNGTTVIGVYYSYKSEGTSPALGIHLYGGRNGNTLLFPAYSGANPSWDCFKWNGITKIVSSCDINGAINNLFVC